MSVLEVDMGNTRAKWRVREASRVLARGVTPSAELPGADLLQELRVQEGRLQAILLAAVCAESICRSAMDVLKQHTGLSVTRVVPVATSRNGLRCAYAEPERLGVDRWLAMLAAHDRRGPEAAGIMVVSCGTAVTLDLVRADGCHEGGYIVPGLFMMREALLTGTGRIRFEVSEFTRDRSAGWDTVTAVQHGAVHSILSLMECSRQDAEHRWQGKVEVWLTGGDAPLLHAAVAVPCHCVEDLVLDGLSHANGCGL